VSQEVAQRLLPPRDLHRRDGDGESSSHLLLALLHHLEQPRDGRGSHAQTLGGAVPANQGVGLTWRGRGQRVEVIWIKSICVNAMCPTEDHLGYTGSGVVPRLGMNIYRVRGRTRVGYEYIQGQGSYPGWV